MRSYGSVLLMSVALFAAAAHAEVKYQVYPVAPAGIWGAGNAINDAHETVGWTYSGSQHAFRKNGAYTDLGTLGGTGAVANAINNKNQAVGYSYTLDGAKRAFLFPDPEKHPDTMFDIPLGTVRSAEALGINDSSVIVGTFTNSAGNIHGFRWAVGDATFKDLTEYRASNNMTARDINNLGQIVGQFNGTTGFLLVPSANKFVELGVAGASSSLAYAINDSSVIVGSWTDGNGTHAFSATVDQNVVTRTDLGGTNSIAYGLNNAGVIVGVAGGKGVMWENGIMIDLNTLLAPDSGWTIVEAKGINADGEISGTAVDQQGIRRAIKLAAPSLVPLPGSAIMGMVLLAGIGAMSLYRYKRHAD